MDLFTQLPSYILFLPLVLVVIFKFGWNKRNKPQYHYPPGPKGHWLLGNAPELPKKNPGLKFAEWGRKYGDMYGSDIVCCLSSFHLLTSQRFSISMGQQRWVVLNRHSVTEELLDKRGRLYISRPYFPVTQNILSGGNRIVIMQHGERWRALRKVMHQLLTAKQVRN
jgi:cytochrome P450